MRTGAQTGYSQPAGQMGLSGESIFVRLAQRWGFNLETIFDSLMHVADAMHLLFADLGDTCCIGSWLPGSQLCMPALCTRVQDVADHEAALSDFIDFVVDFVQCHAMSCIALLQR